MMEVSDLRLLLGSKLGKELGMLGRKLPIKSDNCLSELIQLYLCLFRNLWQRALLAPWKRINRSNEFSNQGV